MASDLHIHTSASDGVFSPSEILEQALENGLHHIAITDHDSVDGVLEIITQDNTLDIDVIPGVELSTDVCGHEVHILGYYINPLCQGLRERLAVLKENRRQRVKKIIIKLQNLGYNISYAEVVRDVDVTSAIGRPYVARVLVKKGYFETAREVFDKLLNSNAPAYVPHDKLSPLDCIELINRSGGIPVLAHPGLVQNDKIVNDMFALGVRGIEVFHPEHSKHDIEKYKDMARRLDLVVTGGSDFHGILARFPERLGVFTVSNGLVMRLKEESQALK